ncbi:MAG: hypothetical protein C7B45_06425 [Sulfobacillus acidophilus]|uniref:Aquaporin family protein n=1 Tax=Sulfobacillus acidophilus TaxID=53633 RepID=A0A2T2WK09_9FIRM|nr:MAG: hypothetical protein C7B45_06425 [Sulfobacillus acidophilus]
MRVGTPNMGNGRLLCPPAISTVPAIIHYYSYNVYLIIIVLSPVGRRHLIPPSDTVPLCFNREVTPSRRPLNGPSTEPTDSPMNTPMKCYATRGPFDGVSQHHREIQHPLYAAVNHSALSAEVCELETGVLMPKAWWILSLSECIGTALLLAVGGSFVVIDFAPTSPVTHWIASAALRRALTGFLFGSTGGLIALSWVGKSSGAHINPVVTLAFWLQKKLSKELALIYIISQFIGAIIGAALLSLWGSWARATHDAATVPGSLGAGIAVLGETTATFCLIVGLFVFLGHQVWRRYTPALFPVLYALLVWIEAPISGTSTNPARTLGPDLIAHIWAGWWVYLAGPTLGTLIGWIVLNQLLPWLHGEITVAKLYHFAHDPYEIFRTREQSGGSRSA